MLQNPGEGVGKKRKVSGSSVLNSDGGSIPLAHAQEVARMQWALPQQKETVRAVGCKPVAAI